MDLGDLVFYKEEDPDRPILLELERFLEERMHLTESGEVEFTPKKEALDSDPIQVSQEFKSEELEQRLGLSRAQVFKKYIYPWKDLKPTDMELLGQYWSSVMEPIFYVKMEISAYSGFHAMEWTIFQAMSVLPGIELIPSSTIKSPYITAIFPTPGHVTPFRQCLYCGRPRPVNKRKPFVSSYCHVTNHDEQSLNCAVSDNNYNHHVDGCCWKEWQILKKRFQTTWKNNAGNEAKQLKHFRSFLERQFNENLKRKIPLNAQRKRSNRRYLVP